jgi:hypothetical protein
MITDQDFRQAISRFPKLEKRAVFYDMAVKLIKHNFEIEAYFLILATWNWALFCRSLKDFDIKKFKEKFTKLNSLNSKFDKMKNKDFRRIPLDEYSSDIKKIFQTLSTIKGIGLTGASKIMHLKNRSVFVMWDGYISGNKPKRYYNKLKIVKEKKWEYKKYEKNAEGYFQFLKVMQERFKNINFRDDEKTFAKAIDEYNYVNITLPIKEMEKKNKN